jgi:hypothetical protein
MIAVAEVGFLSPAWRDVIAIASVVTAVANMTILVLLLLLGRRHTAVAEGYMKTTNDYKDLTARYAELASKESKKTRRIVNKAVEGGAFSPSGQTGSRPAGEAHNPVRDTTVEDGGGCP